MMSPTESPAGSAEAIAEADERPTPMDVDEDADKAPVENGQETGSTPPPPAATDKEEEEEVSPAAQTEEAKAEESSCDVEKFGGKIVYNPDGSAYIIEDGDLSDDDAIIPKVEGSIVERPGDAAEAEQYPQIANAFYIAKGGGFHNALYAKMLEEKRGVPETPVVHSYRVFSARDPSDKANDSEDVARKHPLAGLATVPVKPILMCFVCKLSFGCAQTFESHCVDSHHVELDETERRLLSSKNSSAIIQNVGKEKEPIVSFLEPVTSSGGASSSSPSSAAATAALAAAAAAAAASGSGGNPPPFPPGAISQFLSAAAAAAGLPKVPMPSSSPSPPSGEQRRSPLSATASSTTPSLSNPRRSPLEADNSRSGGASPINHNSSPSPISLPPPPAAYSPQVPTNANMLQGTTIGACPDHVNGRPTGVDCSKCDLILNQSRLSGMGWNVSRNSCKTLKCPKCNWHYKYQETLEIHMKEKHPENETTCIYCITGQQHPRLARGETYTCGYKPYRCEVCNYSTTTKGNLSIHMQSDKHLNNMQDLQNGGLIPPSSTPGESPKLPLPPSTTSKSLGTSQSPLPSPSKQQKPNWRCDVCNYETNVARNLRIHMTSEKHTHNIMSIQQQSAKTMQQLMGGGGAAPGLPGGFPRLPPPPGLDPKNLLNMFAGGLNPPTSGASSEQAAMADLAYNQALLAQIMSGGQFPGGLPPPPFMPPTSAGGGGPDFASIFAAAAAAAANKEENVEPPPETVDPNPKHLFACCVCKAFGCDTLDELSHHLSQDRSHTRENEVSIVIAGNYLCQLCNYKTNLKANFQLHCKTDKHLQRLSHVNHIKEGGPANDWKLRFLTSMNPVELRCNACDFVTNSPHKMQVHFTNQQHQVSALLFNHLKKEEMQKSSNKVFYNCSLCQFSAPGKHLLMGHVRSMKHLQMEQMHQLKKRAEGNLAHTEIGDIFQVVEDGANGDERRSPSSVGVSCPLCQESFVGQDSLEGHAMSVHSVNAEGLARLQALMGGADSPFTKQHRGNSVSSPAASPAGQGTADESKDESEEKSRPSLPAMPALRKGGSDANFNYSLEKYLDPNRPFKCDVCRESFTQKNILLVHYNSVSHLHKLKKTMEQQKKEQESANAASNGESERKSPQQQQQQQEKTPPKKGSALEALVGSMKGDRGKAEDDEVKPFKCNICKVAYSQGSTLDIHIRSVLHQTKASKLQELILTGQVDLTKPLIEQPDPQQLQDQHKKMISDMLMSPKSVNSTGSTNSQSSPNVAGGGGQSTSPNSGGARTGSPQSSPLASLQQALAAGKTDLSSSPEEPTPSSSAPAAPFGGLPFPFLANLASPDQKKEEDNKVDPSPVLKNLLQSYGLEMAKQLGDLQKKKEEEKEEEEAAQQKNLSDMQEALQKAMLQAQLQQMNPMLMQLSQLQQMNPLMAMNLQPPLIPPALLKSAGAGPDLPAALIDQIRKQQQQASPGVAPAPPPMGLMDPKILALMAAGKQGSATPTTPDLAKSLPPPFPGAPPPPPITSLAQNLPPPPGLPDPKTLLMQQQPIPAADQGKRARTRITDDQLKILRSNFDINNSPTEEALHRMAGQTGLPIKVIKHWFRNTLFKERQKNKDSPYNFNNPPCTKLNLEEYEKTGEPKVTPLNPEDQAEYVQQEQSGKTNNNSSGSGGGVKKEAQDAIKAEEVKSESPDQPTDGGKVELPTSLTPPQPPNATTPTNTVPKLNESSSESSLTLSRLLSSQLPGGGALPLPGAAAGLLPNFPAFPNAAAAPLPPTTSPGMPDFLNTLANRMTNQSPRPSSPQSVTSGGKRANRTRFTDYQIKVLQEFFENNAYPKDDDLEYLSKLLSLSPRVIVVWFQNARQKARKIYENQPPANEAAPGAADEETGRFTRTPGCNYQCKKCLLVFQRYYELIRHQKQHCYKEEDAKRSAQAQKAAAQAAAQFVNNTSGGAMPPLPPPPVSEDSESSLDRAPTVSPAATPGSLSNIVLPNAPDDLVRSEAEKRQELAEMSKDAVNRLFGAGGSPFLPNSPFNLLQQQAALQLQANRPDGIAAATAAAAAAGGGESDELDSESLASSPSSKRKLSEDGDADEDGLGHKDKRLRTTILPAQLDLLYVKYQQESNPSRKQLEQIAAEVGLRKRVVQVWFQNTRARERKGLYVKPGAEHDDEQQHHSGDGARPCPPESPFQVSDHIASLIPNSTSAFQLQSSMRKYYEDTMKRFMNDIQDANAAVAGAHGKPPLPPPLAVPVSLPGPATAGNSDMSALDLTSEADNSSDHLDDLETTRSTDADGANGGGGASAGAGGNKRFRTQMTGLQVKMMKAVFEVYKTPTMTECSSLGQDIGLQKRVVQVWFQNARAKEKRAKLQLQQATGQEPEAPPPPEGCPVCPDFRYGHKLAVQDHIFTRAHLDQLKVAIEAGRYDPESPGQALSQTAAVIQNNNGSGGGDASTSSPSVQMLQMSSAPAPPAGPTSQVNSRELLEAMNSHQQNAARMMMQV